MRTLTRSLFPVSVSRTLRFLTGFLFVFASVLSAWAQPVVGIPSTSISFAQAGRTFMDVGGTWSGTADVTSTTGDTFTVTYTNSGTATAYDFKPYVTLPSGFNYVSGTAQVSTSPATPGLSVSTSKVGQKLSFNLSPSGYDLPAGSSITISYGLVTDFTVVSSTPQLVYNRDFSLTDGGALVGGAGSPGQQNVLVKAGDSIIVINPKQQTRAVGETAVFTVTVTSTGLGGIFDATIDESSIFPTGSNLQLLSITQLTPTPSPVATVIGGGAGLKLPYLPSDQTFVAKVEAVVVGCGVTQNKVTSVHRANQVAITDTATVQLNILQPDIQYTPPAVTLDYTSPVLVSFDITNNGLGVALGFNLSSNLNGGGRTIALTPASVTAGWSYNASTGKFSNGRDLQPGASVNLAYTVEITNPCTSSGTGTVTYTPSYTNGCGLALALPQRSHSFASATGTPGLSLSKTVSAGSIPYDTSGTYTLTLSATNRANISAGSITVTDVLPDDIVYLGNTPSVGVVTVVGKTVTWTLSVSNLSVARTLEIDFSVANDPCIAGDTISNTASTSTLTTVRGCNLSANASASFYVPTNPGPSSSQSLSNTGSGIYETGQPDASPVGVKGNTEGDVIPLQASYTFSAGYLGNWAGTTYRDKFGGVSQMVLDQNSVTVSGTFGTNVTVPSSAISIIAGNGFQIDMGFLAGASFFNHPGVSGRTFTLKYKVTAPDAAITSGNSRTVSHGVVLSLAAGIGGPTTCLTASNNLFLQNTTYTLRRAAAQVGLSFPAVIDICDFNELLTITVSNVSALQSRNLLVTLLNAGTDYDYDTSFTPVYGGAFNSGNITYSANGGSNPTFQFTGNPLASSGTIQVLISRKPIANTTPGAIAARVNYDSWQTGPAGSRVYQSNTSYTPSSVRKATLNLNVSPGSIAVTSNVVSYGIDVFNSDSGTGYNSIVTSTIPLGFSVNVADTNAANAYPVNVSAGAGGREVASWSVGDIASNGTRKLQLYLDVGTIPGCVVTINPAIERVQASWGCGTETFATVTATHPSFTFPNGRIQVLHDATQTVARLCSPGKIIISVKNTGPTNVYGLEVQEIISDPSVIFLAGGANPVRYRVNNGSLKNLSSSTSGTGGSGNPYRWTTSQIPELAELVPVGASGVNLISIEIELSSTEDLATSSPLMYASGQAVLTCGSAVLSPAQPFTIPTEVPQLTVLKTGLNDSAGQTSYGETTYGGVEDEVHWRIVITNSGKATASNIRFSDALSGSSGTAVINGPGLAANTPYTANAVLSIPDIAANGGSATYIITEILGINCVTVSPIAQVSWGCSTPASGVHNTVTSPGDHDDAATLVMLPSISAGSDIQQTFTSLPGGRLRADVQITNTGGSAYALAVTNTFPNAGMVLDTTYAPTFTRAATFYPSLTSAISGVTTDNSNTLKPKFTFTSGTPAVPMLRFGDRVTLTYYLRPTVFDPNSATTFPALASSEGTAGSLDPVVPATGTNTIRVDYQSSCGGSGFDTDTATMNPLSPDLDISASSPGNSLISGTATANYTFTIINIGEAGSVADFITADFPNLGAGWTVSSITLTTPGTGGTGGTIPVDGATPFTAAQFGTLSQGQTAVITVVAAYSGTPGPLTLKLRVLGEARANDGAATGNFYSLDQRAQRIVGVALSKTLDSTSEATTSGTNVLVGEEVTYLIRADIFGAEDDLTNVIIRDTPADSNTNAHTNLAYVSHALTGNNQLTFTASAPTPVTVPANLAASRINFTAATITAADINAGTNTFEATLTTRVLNVADNTHNKALRNNLGMEFTYLGQKFRSNDGDDGFSGGTSTGNLHKNTDITVRRPTATVTKTVRNVTTATAFGATAEGQAGDTLEYRIVVTNPTVANAAPLFSISVEDNVPAKLVLLATNIGADTNSDNVPDVSTTGVTGGNGVDITFNSTNTAIANPGFDLDQLNPGKSVVLIYRVTLDQAVNPSETLVNSATVTGYTLPAPSGSQTAPLGTQDSTTGSDAIVAVAAATANVTIIAIDQDKIITGYSGLPADDDRVTIGEQIRYRVTLMMPLGTAPDLSVTDTLPAGLALVGAPVINIGSDIAADNEPPTFVQTNGGQTLTWSFGETVASGADRNITIDYVAQVRNIAGNTSGKVLTNSAAYNFTGLPGDVITLTQRSVTVAQPSVTVTKQVSPAGPVNAGDVLTYTITLVNATGANISSGFDLNLVDTLPVGVTYVAASTTTLPATTGLTGTLGEPEVSGIPTTGQTLGWGRDKAAPVNLDLAPGGTLKFTYQVTVDDTSRPGQVYKNSVVADWTSLDGAPGPDLGDAVLASGNALGERNGNGVAPNTYKSTKTTTVNAPNTTTITKTKAGDTLPRDVADALTGSPSGFRVGDIVTYTLTLPVQEGTLDAFTIADVMPAGLAFIDTVSITPATGAAGFTYTTPVAGSTAPDAAATGTATWSFGTLVNTGDNDTDNDELVVVYRARVLDPAGLAVAPVDQAQNNSATVAFTLADTSTHTSVASIAGITVRQPRLTLAKAIVSPAIDALGNYVRRPGDTVGYRLTVTNTGTAPAYNVKLTDTLPEGMRVTAPVLTAATRNGVDVLATQVAPVWTTGDGTYVFDLADAQLLLPGQTLVLTYTATVDADATKGVTLTNSATINQFFSLPSGNAEAASRRQYDPVGPATAGLVIGLRIDGFVYHDIDLSNVRDGTEDWSGLKPTVFANLVADNAGTDIVFRTVTVAPGTGAFVFDYLPPGDFDIILTDAAGNTVARRPANWLNQTPATGLIAATINTGTGDLVDQNIGLNQGVYSPVLAPTITKTASGESIPAAGPQTAFRIGDLVTYTIDIFPHEGANTTFVVTDKLPLGLAYFDTVSIAQVAGASRYTYITPTGGNAPTAAAEGTLTWNFGTFTNAIADPANNTLRITYRARVINTGTDPLAVPDAAPETTTDGPLTNSAEIGYGNTAISPDPLAAGPATDDITVEQPRLTIAKALTAPALNRLAPGSNGTFTVTVTNDGTAPAYNTRVTDTFPVGIRGTAPTLTAATLNGVNVLANITPTWTAASGTYLFNLSNAQALLPGQTLVLAYQFTVDASATRAATLTNSAVINRYYSKPSNDSTQRRQYAATDPVTADIIVGLRIAGTVYEDADLSDTLNGAEDWIGATKPTIYVNLIDSLGAVYRTETIAPGDGSFNFTNLPADDYTLVVATTDTAIVSDRPANWLYRTPNNGTYDLTATSGDVLAQNFGFYQDTLATAGIMKSQSGGTLPLALPADGYRIGDLVTYTVDLAPQEGSLTDFVVTDVLPAGLVFVETVSIAQPSGASRYTYTAPSGLNAPAADATGRLTWTFGNFANALNGPTDNVLRLTYTARVINTGTGALASPSASPAGTTSTLVNSARIAYDNQDGDPIAAGPATASLDVEQPRLVIAKTRLAPVVDNIVMPGATAQFRLTVTNSGSGPAYNTAIADTLPTGLRAATPTLNAATLNGVSVLGSLTAPVYSAGTGIWSVSLDDTQILLPAGQTLVLDYTVTVDADATKGSVLTNSAQVTSYASKASADTTERRVYPATSPSTQDLIVGLKIDGSVYHQLIPNGTKDVGTEDWSSGTAVVVNLVTNSAVNYGSFSLGANQVLRSVAVPVGDGEFSFTNVPAGDYRIVVTDTAVNTAPSVPATWTFDTPATGSITPVAVSNANITGQDLGLYQGRIISGRVYNDASPFGSRQSEDWTGGVPVVVNLVNTYGAPVVHESIAVPAGAGTYEFTNVPPGSYQVIVAPAGQTTAVTAAAPTNWVFVEPDTGTIGTFALTTSDVTGQEFGLTLGRTVSGFVFNDTNPNGTKDGFEDWVTGTSVIVNLVRASDNSVFASASVPIGAGGYSFTNVPPGDFRIIVTNGAAQSTAVAPASWLFRNPATGSQNITVAGADLTNRNFALFRGRTLAGRVFRDNGASGGTANNGSQTGAEPGIGNVTVRLLSAGLTVLDITQTNGAGDFVLRIPADTVDGATLIVEETNPPQHISTGGHVGDSAGSYSRTTDRLTFVYADADVTGVRFGDVPESSLLTDGAQTILPGATALYQHTFRAGTAGTVTFSTSDTATPSLPWTQVLVRDLNCNGAIDAGEPIIDGVALSVAADEEICLVLKDNSPPNTGFGAKHRTLITAYLAYANSALNETMSREDVTTIGPATSSGLKLVKEVDKTLAQPGEVITYTVTYTNAGSESLSDLFIDDRTPAYTVLAEASTYTLPLPAGLTVGTVTEPAVNAAGSIRWTFGGVLTPGASGSVIFKVKVQE